MHFNFMQSSVERETDEIDGQAVENQEMERNDSNVSSKTNRKISYFTTLFLLIPCIQWIMATKIVIRSFEGLIKVICKS